MADRLFVALAVPDGVKQRIADWQAQHQLARAKAIPQDNLHLTLAFLGQCDARLRAQVCQALRHITGHRWQQHLDQTGWFNKPAIGFLRPTSAAPELVQLAGHVQQAMTQLGVKLPQQAFKPHVSVFRQLHQGDHWNSVEFQGQAPNLTWLVEDFRLYQSLNGHYIELERWPLHAPSKTSEQ